MGDRRVQIRCTGRRVGGILTPQAMHLVEVLGLGVVGFHILIGDRPSWGDATVVLDLAEVFLAQADARRHKTWCCPRRSS